MDACATIRGGKRIEFGPKHEWMEVRPGSRVKVCIWCEKKRITGSTPIVGAPA